MNKAMAWVRKPFWPLTKTKWAILVTVLYIGVIGSIRYDALQLLWCGKLNELGDFLAGFFTPLAFLWLVVGYFLQKEELSLQNEELGLQRKELEEARRALGSQAKVMEERAERERLRIMPALTIKGTGQSSRRTEFSLLNSGGPAHRFVLTLLEDDSEERKIGERDQLATTEAVSFSIPDVPSTNAGYHRYTCIAVFASELHETFHQRWSIIFTGEVSPSIKIQKEEGPALLKANVG